MIASLGSARWILCSKSRQGHFVRVGNPSKFDRRATLKKAFAVCLAQQLRISL